MRQKNISKNERITCTFKKVVLKESTVHINKRKYQKEIFYIENLMFCRNIFCNFNYKISIEFFIILYKILSLTVIYKNNNLIFSLL